MKRYDRQEKFHAFGNTTQKKLQNLCALIIGVGALGSGIAEQLVRSGIGKLIIVDRDIVTLSNLHRQSGYLEVDANEMKPKVFALKERLQAMNSEVKIEAMNMEVLPQNILSILETHQPDVVLDGLDRFETRYLVNEATNKMRIPYIYSAVLGSQVSVFPIDSNGPCLQCIMPEPPETMESCALHGVLPPAVHIASSFAVAEVFNYLMTGMFSYDMKWIDIYKGEMKSTHIVNLKEEDCPVCRQHHYQRLKQSTIEGEYYCGNVIQVRYAPEDFDKLLSPNVNVIKQNQFVKLLEYRHYKMTFFQDGRLLIYGSENKNDALEVAQLIFVTT
ncbi:ThiF family adenylyltransferase [Staphylococcus ratti]|uniref:ThiF family adenylyltransferase n=1 Tax=Staphylococcus ratti TaxID=2892440 RepID=A0ABY3PFS6_9STAP|nr:ThiF family adenylyltransferase [Staphylococcus ratti]UEX91185.1 ThiF family adenylyltransferase [Staphylococcus ratti]